MLQSVADWIINLVNDLGYLGIFIAMTIESASIPLPSEIIMGISGYLVYKGEMNLFLAGLAGAFGNITGSTIMYIVGLKGGRPVVKRYGKYLHFNEEKFNKVEKWFGKWGDKIIFISQLLPGVRTFVSLPGGILKVSYPKFILYTFTGAFIWCTLLAYISKLLGPEWEKLGDYIKELEIALLIVFLLFGLIFAIRYVYTKRLKLLSAAANQGEIRD